MEEERESGGKKAAPPLHLHLWSLCLCGKSICIMATEIKLPMLGENVDSGVVINVLVSEGDEVAEGQPVIELETEKATIEVPASASGRVKEISVKEGRHDQGGTGDLDPRRRGRSGQSGGEKSPGSRQNLKRK